MYSWFKNDPLWAKKSDSKLGFMWLPLSQHLEDTKNIIGLLWEHWLSSNQKHHILQGLNYEDSYDGKRFVQFLGAIHDLGKATPIFQKQKSYAGSSDLDAFLIEKLERAGFAGLGTHLYSKEARTSHALAGQVLLRHFAVKDDISSIIGGHHGKPIDDPNFYNNHLSYLSHYIQRDSEDPEDKLASKWRKTQQTIFDWALKTTGHKSVEDLPSVKQTAQVLLSGLLIMADWIASNESYFPLINVYAEVNIDQMERSTRAWKAWFKPGTREPDYVFDINSIYKKRFGEKFNPRNAQRVFFETIDSCQNPGLFIFEATMGLGKTEAALVGAEQLASKLGQRGIFFALPTQATSNSMFSRIKTWLEKLDGFLDEKNSVQLLHAKSALNKEFANLPRAKNINIDEGFDFEEDGYHKNSEEEGSIAVNQWFSGRKTSILDDFVVGTIDHILLAALKQKHLALRHLGISRKVVIIDEVHAYDAYMNQYLIRVLEWLGAYNVPVILLSATLAASTREELVKAYLKGKGLRDKEIEIVRSVDLNTTAYPLITYTDGKQICQQDEFVQEKDTVVAIKRIDDTDIEAILDKVLARGGNVGIILNTVNRTQDMAKKCSEKYGEDRVFLLHSYFIDTERVKKENELLALIGKKAKRPKHKIIIGTQVIEQSLDIDFDLLISDLAPVDLLIQRVGRLHRHEIKRPEHFQTPVLYLLGTSSNLEFEAGSETVYGGYLLARTQYYLPDTLKLPSDISPLVQKVYGKEDILLADDKQEKYQEMFKNFKKQRTSQQERAESYRLNGPQYVARRNRTISLISWLGDISPKQSEEYGYAQVRDIQETIEVIALKKCDSGYSFIDDNQDISNEIDNPKVAMKIAASSLRLPTVFSYQYGENNVDQTIEELEAYNVKHLKEWQEQSWLKGTLGIIFDENLNFQLGNKILHYDMKYGLTYEEMEKKDE
ncbi:MAG: CRISPR-associated helicase Cas3' [Clostridiaceae bacterium]|nr:CRISPR-associated helicase Cas3' [Clostridiaceae bacterium]